MLIKIKIKTITMTRKIMKISLAQKVRVEMRSQQHLFRKDLAGDPLKTRQKQATQLIGKVR